MAKLSKKTLIGIKSESTQGTAASLGTNDYFYAMDVSYKSTQEKLNRDVTRTYLDTLPHVIGKQTVQVTFKTELKGSGSAGVYYNPLSSMLAACGLTAALIGGTAIVFSPSSSSESSSYYGAGRSATIEIYKDGIKHVVPGAMGTVKINCEASKIATLDFSFKGLWNEPTDASFPTNTVNKVIPPIVQNSTLTVQGFTPVASKFDLDLGVNVAERDDVSSSAGVLGYQIVAYDAKGSYDPEVPTLAAHNMFNRLATGTTGAANIVIGTDTGNKYQITCPCVQYDETTYADKSGLLTFTAPLKISSNNGNDFISITAF